MSVECKRVGHVYENVVASLVEGLGVMGVVGGYFDGASFYSIVNVVCALEGGECFIGSFIGSRSCLRRMCRWRLEGRL